MSALAKLLLGKGAPEPEPRADSIKLAKKRLAEHKSATEDDLEPIVTTIPDGGDEAQADEAAEPECSPTSPRTDSIKLAKVRMDKAHRAAAHPQGAPEDPASSEPSAGDDRRSSLHFVEPPPQPLALERSPSKGRKAGTITGGIQKVLNKLTSLTQDAVSASTSHADNPSVGSGGAYAVAQPSSGSSSQGVSPHGHAPLHTYHRPNQEELAHIKPACRPSTRLNRASCPGYDAMTEPGGGSVRPQGSDPAKPRFTRTSMSSVPHTYHRPSPAEMAAIKPARRTGDGSEPPTLRPQSAQVEGGPRLGFFANRLSPGRTK